MNGYQAAIFESESGATRQALTKAKILAWEVPQPPLEDQHRIVEKIEAVTAKSRRAKEALDAIPPLLERFRQSVLAAAFRGDLTKEWRDTTVGDVAVQVFDGPFGSHLKSDDYAESGGRVVRLENIAHMRFIEDKQTFVPRAKFRELARHTLRAHDVLFSSFIDQEVRVCLFPEELDGKAINKADCFCVRVDPTRCLPEFLLFRLACRSVFESLSAEIHGATRPRINLGQLKSVRFKLPTIEVQHKVVKRVREALARVNGVATSVAAAKTRADAIDASILAKAFRGELVEATD